MNYRAAPITILIGQTTLRSIDQQAVRHAPAEACGALLGGIRDGGRRIDTAIESLNVTKSDPATFYQLDPRLVVGLLLGARRTDRQVLGFYHSHTESPAGPSTLDRDLSWPDKTYLIVAVSDGKVTERKCWRRPVGQAEFVEDTLVVGPF